MQQSKHHPPRPVPRSILLVRGVLGLVLISLLSGNAAQGYAIGHRVVSWVDAARGNRPIPTDVFYPADVAGDDVPVASPPPAGFPVVAFGHGFLLGSDLYSFVQNTLAPAGYIVVLPATEGGPLPDHADFGADLAFLAEALKQAGSDPASFLFGAVAARAAVGGHSMGGGASFLAGEQGPAVDAVFNFAAAETSPSAIAAAADVIVPTLVIAAENDCVAPPGIHQIPMYDASASPCRIYTEIDAASHCQFNDYSFTCELGELFCNPGISRSTQFALTTAILRPWLDAVLREAPGAWGQLQAELAGASYDVMQDCPSPPLPLCGNGFVGLDEQCDDGNPTSGDCCDADCSFEAGPGTPPCCDRGLCQTGAACGAACGDLLQCAQPGGIGSPCLCEAP